MKMHANARLSLKGRELLVDRVENAGWSLSAAAEAAGISDRTARKWLARYRTEGPGGLLDRSSAPVVVANRTEERRVEVIAALRRLRMTGAEIGHHAPSRDSGTVVRCDRRSSDDKGCTRWVGCVPGRRVCIMDACRRTNWVRSRHSSGARREHE